MDATMTITLTGLHFHAFHGIYPEELKTGNDFSVDLAVAYAAPDEVVTDVGDTINYVSLYDIIKQAMQKPRGLLETLAMEIANRIHNVFPQVKNVDISIRKMNPPIAGITGDVGVRYHKDFTDYP